MEEVKTNKTFVKPNTDARRHVVLTVGDTTKSNVFSSFLQINAWGEDVVTFDNETIEGKADFDGQRVNLSGASSDYDEQWVEDGGVLRWKRILKRRPGVNTYHFKLGGNWGDFDFFRQLDNAHLCNPTRYTIDHDSVYSKAGDEWDSWEYQIAGITERVRCPVSAHGSIAVYHKNKKDNKYQTGKICHILMPKLTRADGRYVWADSLEIINGYLVVTLPQKFLDDAETDGQYPIEINDTFGDSATGSNILDFNKNTYRCFGGPYSPASNGTLDSIVAYFENGGKSDEGYTAALYPDSSGSPDSQSPTAVSSETTVLASGGTGERTFTCSSESISSSSSYWFCLGHGGANNNWDINIDWTGGSQGYDVESYSAGTAPDPYNWTYLDAKKATIYGNYTVSGGGISIPIAMHHYKQMAGNN